MFSRADKVLAMLLLATAITVGIGERGDLSAGRWWPVLLVFGLAAGKAAAVMWEFMGLAHAPPLWRRLLLGWLVVVTAGIWVAHAVGLRGATGG